MTTDTVTISATARRQQAEGRLRVIRNALAVADEELEAALVDRDWEVFGLASFEAYCAEKIPEFRHFKMRAPARRERAAKLLAKGATEREIAAATGASVGTAHNDVLALTGRAVLKNEQTEATAESPAATPPSSLSTIERAVALVATQGARGLTYIELCHETGWRGGQATGALSRAEKRGLIRRVPTFRDRCAAYVCNS